MKKLYAMLLMLCLVLTGCKSGSSDTDSDEIVLEANQSLVYGQVTAINGNELTIALATEMSSSDVQSSKGNKGNRGDSSSTDSALSADNSQEASGSLDESDTGTGQMPGGSFDGSDTGAGQMPGGSSDGSDTGTGQEASGSSDGSDAGAGQMPSGEAPSGDMGGGTPPDMSSDSQGGMPGADSSSADTQSESGSSDTSGSDNQQQSSEKDSSSDSETESTTVYVLTGEEEDVMIPVGTTVTTILGTTTTFSRIAVDDTLKLLMQTNDEGEEVIVGVWIVA